MRLSPNQLYVMLAIACGGCSVFAPGSRPPSRDVQFAESTSAAMIAFDHGDLAEACKLYEVALQRGRAMDDATSIADAAYNLAACEISLSRYDAAARHLREAKYNRTSDGKDADAILLLMAKLAYLRENDGDAETIARSLDASKSAVIHLQAQTLLTLISCDLKKVSEAQARLDALREIKSRLKDLSPSLLADVEKAEGAVARVEGRPHDAAAHFDSETALLALAHRYRDTIHALSRSAEMHNDAGEFSASADRYYRAARGCAAVNDPIRAMELAQRALSVAKAGGNVDVTELTQNLITEIHTAANH
jgi:tetratricopeptide (TPR) repeat protein